MQLRRQFETALAEVELLIIMYSRLRNQYWFDFPVPRATTNIIEAFLLKRQSYYVPQSQFLVTVCLSHLNQKI
jgi:hypothetical protein